MTILLFPNKSVPYAFQKMSFFMNEYNENIFKVV